MNLTMLYSMNLCDIPGIFFWNMMGYKNISVMYSKVITTDLSKS